MEAKNFEEYK